jgi:type VI secretion system Hcp family effector
MSRENRSRRLAGRTVKIAVPTVAALGAGTAIAAGAIPGSDGVIHGCYRQGGGPNDGSLRVVDDPASCAKNETAIQWSQQGPKGDQGIQGIQGVKGDQGVQGPPGANGSEATIVGGVPLDGGTATVFLTGTGLQGSVNDKANKDAVAVKSFSFSASEPATIGTVGGGGGAGKVTFDAFHIQKLYDSSSPTFLADLASGKHLSTVTVSFQKPGDSSDFLVYTFDDVLVTSYKQGGDAVAPLLENIGMDFGSVEWKLVDQNSDGSSTTVGSGGWDVTQNKAE